MPLLSVALTLSSRDWLPTKYVRPLETGEIQVTVGEVESKVAVTDLAEFMLRVQVPLPVQAPLQPAKVEELSGAAVRMTVVL